MNHEGVALPSFSHDFAVSDLSGIGSDVVSQGYGNGTILFNSFTGVSLRRFITSEFTFPVDSVEAATLACPGIVGPNRLSPTAGDLADPAALGDAYPFVDNLPPVFALGSTGDPDGFEFVVNARKQQDSTLTSGADGTASPGAPMTLTLQLEDKVLTPALTAEPASVKVGDPVTFHADVTNPDSSETLHWTWQFGDGGTDDTAAQPSATYTYTDPDDAGTDRTVTATLAGDHGSTGVARVSIHIDGSPPSTPTDPTTPPTGTSHGAGGSIAPTDGPRTGDGPREGGVGTNRPGTGAAGPTFAPGSASATASPTASGDAAEVGGSVVGYLLSDATGVAVPRDAAPRALDDSAAAARNGTTPLRWGWIVGVIAVVALLALGAGSERRRPLRARRRR